MNCFQMFRVGLGVVLLSVSACRYPATMAQDAAPLRPARENAHVWRPQTRSVAVFENGLGFFMREGSVQLRDGWCVAGEVPPAAFGTLAIYSLSDEQSVDIVGSGPGEIVDFDGATSPMKSRSSGGDSKPAGSCRLS